MSIFEGPARNSGWGLFIFLWALAVVLWSPLPAQAHPHVFVDNSVTFVFEGSDLAGVRVHWVFDDMFGTMIREDHDQDRDGAFSEAEIKTVKIGAFDNLKNFDYFTFLEVDGEQFRVQQIQDFRAGFFDGKLFYDFFVPCRVSGVEGQHTVLLSVHDPEYYADVYTPEDAVLELENTAGVKAQASVVINSERTYSSFQVWTSEITLTFGAR
ncbi:DUF1007 family protein [Desulfovibrio ferrophilus]|uniref:ABC-type uncharacterized transport system periplasmic component-like protein n=1 Tax=Desulfovibrio ferrophilus TaxID=241368 RepID=A0A2Z6B399_9BACT|nr:DUF1007 family protein [Desulfovibrio ferrophilus]BBD09918.1 ABC-type uncharacterized transport system periplasmic component-like protein [Desulfovibrio ferrophilus]